MLERLLEVHGVTVDGERFARLRRRKAGDDVRMRIARLLARITRHFSAVHMTWGAINESRTLTGYQALIARSGNPLVTTVLARIIKDERRHYSFYFNQARERLEAARGADTDGVYCAQFLVAGRKSGARRCGCGAHLRLSVR